MSWSPQMDYSDDLKISFEMYEEQDNYGLNRRGIRPGKIPLNVAEHDDVDDGTDDMPPDAKVELQLDAYRRRLGFPNKTVQRQWGDEATDNDSSVDLEISAILRNTGLDREPIKNPLNSKTTAKTAIPLDKFSVAGVKDLYLTKDHFKFDNVYVHSKPAREEEPVKLELDYEAPRTNTESNTAHRKTFKEPKMGVAGEQYVSPRALYAMKGRRNR